MRTTASQSVKLCSQLAGVGLVAAAGQGVEEEVVIFCEAEVFLWGTFMVVVRADAVVLVAGWLIHRKAETMT